MGKYYDQTIEHPFEEDRVFLYTLKTSKKPNWYVRILRTTGKGYYKTSLKTTDRAEALAKAKSIYLDMYAIEDRGIAYNERRFNVLFQRWLKSVSLSKGRKQRVYTLNNRYFSEFFADTKIDKLDNEQWEKYVEWRTHYWSRPEIKKSLRERGELTKRCFNVSHTPSAKTIRSERQILKQFLLWCVQKNYLDIAPKFEWDFRKIENANVRTDRVKAKAISPRRYAQINYQLKKFCIDQNEHEDFINRKFGRYRLFYFCKWAHFSLVRPTSELTEMKWEDVIIERSSEFKDHNIGLLEVNHPKVGEQRYAVMPFGQVHYITEWRRLSREFGLGKAHQHVFPKFFHKQLFGDDYTEPLYTEPARADQMGRFLKNKLEEWGLRSDLDGKLISLYAYTRHSGISRRLTISKWSLAEVATACGSSPLEVSRTYYKDWVRANADKYANTFRSAQPDIQPEKLEMINVAVESYKRLNDADKAPDLYDIAELKLQDEMTGKD